MLCTLWKSHMCAVAESCMYTGTCAPSAQSLHVHMFNEECGILDAISTLLSFPLQKGAEAGLRGPPVHGSAAAARAITEPAAYGPMYGSGMLGPQPQNMGFSAGGMVPASTASMCKRRAKSLKPVWGQGLGRARLVLALITDAWVGHAWVELNKLFLVHHTRAGPQPRFQG